MTYTDKQLGEVLKEFAKQVDDKTEIVLMWAYGKDFPFNKKVTYRLQGQTARNRTRRTLHEERDARLRHRVEGRRPPRRIGFC